ncbi:nuclease-related domain-containing protein [Pseudodesulfovibrio pelocollis]|uniref:nuclease-related domain-containing protein n=1 Tax=Pseudodesulfovibrio pelocollis TaxID=3051432 RepID=UPI00255AD94E|nr:nuclease-related domain-containing protein [Pseudodesulfovibrio sp. SB368]
MKHLANTTLFLLGFLLLAVHAAQSAEPYHFAFSKKKGVDVFVVSDGDAWCQRLVEIQIRLAADSPLAREGVEAFFGKQVGPLLNAQCPSVERAIITVIKAETGQRIASIRASRDEGWTPRAALHWTDNKWVLAGSACLVGAVLLWAVVARRRRTARTSAPRQVMAAPEHARGVSQPNAAPHIVTAPEYHRRLRAIPDRSAPDNGGSDGAGRRGEAAILRVIRGIGGGIVYWGLGLSFERKRCEFDILIVAPRGVLHVEVKNLSGTWKPDPDSMEDGYATKWIREKDGLAMKSPISQAHRARFLLGEAARIICSYQLPVHSVVVVANDTFEFTGEKDDRVSLMRDSEFRAYYEEYAHGRESSVVGVAKPRLARLPLYVMRFKQLPVCFDLRSFGRDRRDIHVLREWTDEDFDRELRCLLMEAWQWDKIGIDVSAIWFGSSDDVHPEKAPPDGYE